MRISAVVVVPLLYLTLISARTGLNSGHRYGGHFLGNVLEVIINGLPHRIFHNGTVASPAYSQYNGLNGDLCLPDGSPKGATSNSDPAASLATFTPSRRIQRYTIKDGLAQRLQLAVVLAVGGHQVANYNYGPGGSVNGLMAVWDSWLEFFFAQGSNTTSLVLL